MRWFLQRVTGMAGVADVEDDFGYDEGSYSGDEVGCDEAQVYSDADVSEIGLTEGEDDSFSTN
jgi:hypothetical protein